MTVERFAPAALVDFAEQLFAAAGLEADKAAAVGKYLVEADLMGIVPQPYLTRAHHWLILHGRYTCVARRPRCEVCPVRDLCPSRDLFI